MEKYITHKTAKENSKSIQKNGSSFVERRHGHDHALCGGHHVLAALFDETARQAQREIRWITGWALTICLSVTCAALCATKQMKYIHRHGARRRRFHSGVASCRCFRSNQRRSWRWLACASCWDRWRCCRASRHWTSQPTSDWSRSWPWPLSVTWPWPILCPSACHPSSFSLLASFDFTNCWLVLRHLNYPNIINTIF